MRFIAIALLIIFFTVIRVSAQKALPLENDTIVTNTFTEPGTRALKEIVSYFDSIVLGWSGTNEVAPAYHKFLDELYSSFASGRNYEAFYLMINGGESKRNELFERLKEQSFFNEIWYYSPVRRIVAQDTSIIDPVNLYTLEINTMGLYVEYLGKLSKVDEKYREIYDVVTASGAFGPSIGMGVIKNNHLFDFSKEYNRLFMAINCLSFDKSAEMKLKEYLEREKEE